MKQLSRWRLMAVIGLVCAVSTATIARGEAFYAGKTIRFVVGFTRRRLRYLYPARGAPHQQVHPGPPQGPCKKLEYREYLVL